MEERENVDVLKVKTRRGNEIVGMYVKNNACCCSSLTMLYSHGNAADLGQIYQLLIQLSLHLGVNIMGLVQIIIRLSYIKEIEKKNPNFFNFGKKNYNVTMVAYKMNAIIHLQLFSFLQFPRSRFEHIVF